MSTRAASSGGQKKKALAPYRAPLLTAAQQTMLAQGWFDWAVPRFEWVVTRQAAACITGGRDSVVRLIQEGKLEAWPLNVTGERGDWRISRRSLLMYMAQQLVQPGRVDPVLFAEKAVAFCESIQCERLRALMIAALQKGARR